MPKGRVFAPPTDKDGLWYRHRGLPSAGPPRRDGDTSTGLMLTAPFRAHTACYPPHPPKPYHDKDARNFKHYNRFSSHDNRHSFQDHGVYLGDGRDTRFLGKKLNALDSRQHATEKHFLKHYNRAPTDYDYDTNYSTNYLGQATRDPPKTRRFPKVYKDPTTAHAKLTTKTTSWFMPPDVPYDTPLHVLAVSQEPFLPSNHWKYSYHGLAKCYPPYDRVDKSKPFSIWEIPGTMGLREATAVRESE